MLNWWGRLLRRRAGRPRAFSSGQAAKLEAAVVSFDTMIIRDAGVWFNKHWNSAEIVDKPTLKEFRPFWLQKQRERAREKGATNLLSRLVKDPQFVSTIPIRLLVFEEVNSNTDYTKAGAKVRNEYTDEEIRTNGYTAIHLPFYLDHSAHAHFRPREHMVDYWAAKKGPKSFRCTGSGGVWRFKRIKWIVLNGKKNNVLLFDLVKEVKFWKFPDEDWAKLGVRVKDYLNKTKIPKHHILVDVPLGRLPKSIFSSLKKRLSPKKRRSASK